MNLSFSNPWLLVALPILLPAFYVIGRGRMARLPAWLRRAALVTRLTIIALLVIALARPLIGRASGATSVVFAVDRSLSVSSDARAAADSFVAQALALTSSDRRAGIVGFGRDTAIERPIDGPAGVTQPVVLQTDGSDMSEAIRLARSMFPRSGAKRIVLVSDGRENIGRAEDEARAAFAAGIQISVVPLAVEPPPDVFVEALDIAPQIREGDALDVVIAVGSTREVDAAVRLWVDGKPVSDQTVRLFAGSNRFTATQNGLKRGFHTFWARVESASDTFAQNNELAGYTVVKDKPRVLVLATAESEVRELREALVASDIQVDIRPPSSIPPRLSPMRRYDGLIIANVPASSFSFDQMKTIQGYVQSLGGGLLMIGGETSYSLGDYAKTPLADVLPVTMNIPGKRDRGSVAMVLIIDKSGSMDMREDGTTKMQMAREAAVLALDSLDENDRIGVLTFDTQTRWAIQPRRLGNTREVDVIRDRIRVIEASGGTEIYPALDAGFKSIREQPSRYKHIILLSDGRSLTNADYDRLLASMRQDSVTLSTIAIGSDSDTQLLEELAKQGEGRYYFVDKARDVPKVTTREAKIASGSPIVEGQIKPKLLSPSPIMRAIPPVGVPELGGYLVTTIKDQAQTVLAPDDVRADPILAQWQYGLGRSVAWTSDIRGKWTSAWFAWPDFRRFWSQAVRWTLASPSDPNLQVIATLDGKNLITRVDALDDDGVFRDGQDLRLTVTGQTFQIVDQTMRQIAPGRYESVVPVEDQGVYAIDVAQFEGGRVVRTESVGAVVPYPSEYRQFGTDDVFLSRLAAMTGGKIVRDPRGVFAPDGLRFHGLDWRPIWPWLVGLALLLFPLDIAMRRLQVPTELFARWLGRVAGALPWRRGDEVA
ncbi:MAG: VWA domain-containing protein [Chloroflexota bacterium]|nr:MAG: VWA domain-containing protein [Chloroflexota bacterium]